MHRPILFTTATLPVPNSISRSALRRSFPVVLLALVLASFALPQTGPAVTSAPDGGYPNRNTAEGEDALFSLTDVESNTATGEQALFHNTTQLATTTQPMVSMRCFAIHRATAI